MNHLAIVSIMAGIWLATYNVTVANAAECVPKGQKVNLEDKIIASLHNKLWKQMSDQKLRRGELICIFGRPDNIYSHKQKLPKFADELKDKEHLITYGNPTSTPIASNALYFVENADGKIRLFRHFSLKEKKVFEFEMDRKNIYIDVDYGSGRR